LLLALEPSLTAAVYRGQERKTRLELSVTSAKDRTLFIYWGRRGAISDFVLELAKVAGGDAVFSIARQNELFGAIERSGASVVPIDTFTWGIGAIFGAIRLPTIRRELLAAIANHRIDQVVVLMSHVWTPLIAGDIRRSGTRYVVVVHDASGHPGDATGLVNNWLLRDSLKADKVITLSNAVTKALTARYPQLQTRTTTFFLPMFRSGTATIPRRNAASTGFLFFGRLMAYKGLPLFVEACEILRARGLEFRIGVAGEGNLGDLAGRLGVLGAEVVNRWLDHDEVARVFRQYDCVVLSNIEASQSGVVALAHGFGMPVVAMPVGGLIEQIKDGDSGLIAHEVSAVALADAMQLYLTDRQLQARLTTGVAKTQNEFSMARFYELIIASSAESPE
jgi:glycosyltransferase involved in cell wall biosynthesis